MSLTSEQHLGGAHLGKILYLDGVDSVVCSDDKGRLLELLLRLFIHV